VGRNPLVVAKRNRDYLEESLPSNIVEEAIRPGGAFTPGYPKLERLHPEEKASSSRLSGNGRWERET
jgi:hypothetical protein